MVKTAYAAVLLGLVTTVAGATQIAPRLSNGTPQVPILQVHHEMTDNTAPAQMLASLPSETWTINDWYKQSVYDRSDNKLGEVADVLVDHDGKINAFIIGVGGFLGIGEKDVAVPYSAVLFKKKDNNTWQAMMNTTKDALSKAPGFKFDRTTKTWMAANPPSGTVGGPPLPAPHER